MSQALYRKWRPRLWDEVVAQDPVVQTLRNAVRTGRIGHAYLLCGPRGTGKTTTARLLAKALNCLAEDPAARPCDQCEHCQSLNEGRFLDLIEIDAASNTSVDDVRELRDKINFSPTQGRYKVYIIDEVHMLSTAAFNALLKTLEEPPPHAIFILATTEVHKIPATVLSRVQRHEFRRIPVSEIKRHLREKAQVEGLEVDDEALTLIARQATGAMRDAISLLDQLSSTGQRVTLAEAQEVLGTATSGMVLELVDSILARDPARGLAIVQSALDAGSDARQFARQVVDYLRSVLLVRIGSAESIDVTAELRSQMAAHAGAFEGAQLLEAIKLFNNAATDTRSSWHPGLALELAMAEVVAVADTPAAVQAAPARVVETTARAEAPRLQAAPPSQAPARPAAAPASLPPEPDFEEPPESEPVREPVPQKPAARPVQSPAQPAANRTSPAQASTAQASPAQEAAAPVQKPAVDKPSGTRSPEPAAAPEAGGRVVTQADVQQQWVRIRQMVQKENRLTGAALNSCVSRVLKDNILTLGFQTEVVKLKMETAENLDLLRKTIQAILGVNLVVRCVVVGGKGGQQSDDVDGDGMVGTALNLGGKIMHKE